VRGEANNVFNFVNLGNPGTSFTASTLGQITGTYSSVNAPPGNGPRTVQIGARILF